MAKNLLVFVFFLISAFSCPTDNEITDNVLTVAEDSEETHTPTGLKIAIKNYDVTKVANLLGGLIDVEQIKDLGKEVDLDKVVVYTAILPNGQTDKGYLIVSELPKSILNFQKDQQNYAVRAISIDDDLGGLQVKFEILPQQKTTTLQAAIQPTPEATAPYLFEARIDDNETFTDSRTDAHFFVRSHDLAQQTVTGDLMLPNTERQENITLKPMQLSDFEHNGIKYQFGTRKIEEYSCQFFVREIQ